MINEDLILDAFISVEENSHWSECNFSCDEINALSLDDLQNYARDISFRLTNFGYEISRICEAVKTLRKYQH